MIKHIKLKFGRAVSTVPESILTTPVTVFVGPNNSGKSKVLAEINRFCRTGQRTSTDVIVEAIEFNDVPSLDIEAQITHITVKPNPGEAVHADHIIVGKAGGRVQVNKQSLCNALLHSNQQAPHFCQWFLTFATLILDGKSRINLVNEQPAGDLQLPAQSSLQVLFREDTKRSEVRKIVHDAFGLYFVIDPTNVGKLRVRLSAKPPDDARTERGLHAEAVEFHSRAMLIDQASDGVKAFTGILTEVVAGDPKVLLIDEPEAFLHPSLSAKLGTEIAKSTLGSDKRLFVSTYSPNFVMGCIQSGAPVNIVRLTYRDGAATARVLPNSEIVKLMRHPLLRSTGVLSGLFYESVVVTESDADRAFYQEINERLLRFRPEWGIPNCLFLNAQNKQTVRTITGPLRELGIPAAGIVDVDVLKEGGQPWTSLLSSANVPHLSHSSLSGLRGQIKAAIEATGRNMKRDGGVEILQGAQKEAVNNLFDQLGDYGVFVVRGGELESWLKHLGASGHGPSWLIEIFEKMGEDPDATSYVRPTEGDVWAFLNQIKRWLMNPSRKGIPG